jgi:hypothetical protein
MDDNPLQVYKAWPESTVREAFDEFKRQMYDDAGQEELRAGIMCFDFITKRSDLPEQLIESIEYSMMEARWRISLLDDYDADQRQKVSTEETIDRAIEVMAHMKRSIQGLRTVITMHAPDDPLGYIRRMNRERQNKAS